MNEAWEIAGTVGVTPFLVGGLLLGLFLYNRRLQAGGLGTLARRQFRRNARPGRARVLDAVHRASMWSGIAYEDYTVVLEIMGEGDDAGRRVQMKLRWNWEKWQYLTQGREIPVLLSPDFPDRVLPDYAALRHERNEGEQSQREADEERQRKLLERGR